MIKINLPNPREMSITEFFAQMRIALKSAEKSYEEMIKGIELTEETTPWASFRITNIDKLLALPSKIDGFISKESVDEFTCEDDSQEICLELDRQ